MLVRRWFGAGLGTPQGVGLAAGDRAFSSDVAELRNQLIGRGSRRALVRMFLRLAVRQPEGRY